MQSTETKLYKLSKHSPRRNLPDVLSKKRGESNFVSAFAKAYIATMTRRGIGASEFALSGFGIADFVWLAWRKSSEDEDGSGISLERLKAQLDSHRLTAFEMKLTDWRKGLAQAYRYSYFADSAVVVVPPPTAKRARAQLEVFMKLRVGLWSFDNRTGKIRKLFTPAAPKPKNAVAKAKALASFTRYFEFSQRRKLPQAIGKRL